MTSNTYCKATKTGIKTKKVYIAKLQELLPLKSFNFAHDRLLEASRAINPDIPNARKVPCAKYYILNLVNDHTLKPQLNYIGIKFQGELYGIISEENLAYINHWVINQTLTRKIEKACKKGIIIDWNSENGLPSDITPELELCVNEKENELKISLTNSHFIISTSLSCCLK